MSNRSCLIPSSAGARVPWEAYILQGKYDLATQQLAMIEKLCGKDWEYYEDLAGADRGARASIIEPLLPNKPRGVARADDRKVLNGIYWRLRTGSPWADIPERYGPATTCYNRFVRWAKIGVWDRIFEAVSKAYDGDLQMIDSPLHPCPPARVPTSKRGFAKKRRRRWGPRWNPMHGAFAGRTDHQDPCARRCQRPAHSRSS